MSMSPCLPVAVATVTVRLGVVAALLLACQAQAVDPPNSPSRRLAESKLPAAPTAPAASTASTALGPAATLPVIDPLQHLRRRLAEKLSGPEAKLVDSEDTVPVVKMVNRGAGTETPAVAPDARRPAAPAKPAAPASARLAVVRQAESPERHVGKAGAAVHATAGGETLHWAYQGAAGPQAWGDLRAEFATCSSGQRQSPIDIRDGLKLQLNPIKFNYVPSMIRVIDNGHTVQVNVGAGNTLEVSGRHFELVQFHFHKPSEERIDGRRFDMVAHLVHKDLDGKLAVVAVLLSSGSAQPLIQAIWNNLPLEKGLDQLVPALVDVGALLPATPDYYTYMGSLTTPPCTEGVLWMVMKTPVEVSPQQIGIFDRLYPMNARPVQSASGRMIKESN